MRMNTETMFLGTCLAVSALSVLPMELLGSTTHDFGGQEIAKTATSIKDLIFGPAMRYAGVLGGAYGMFQAIVSTNVKPLLVYGAIGVGINIVPKFIDSVFPGTVATLLLP